MARMRNNRVMTSETPCCWARVLLAAPADGAMPEPVACASRRCGVGTCRHTQADRDGPGARDDAIWDARRLGAFGQPPDRAELTNAILKRLDEEGLLPAPRTN